MVFAGSGWAGAATHLWIDAPKQSKELLPDFTSHCDMRSVTLQSHSGFIGMEGPFGAEPQTLTDSSQRFASLVVPDFAPPSP